MGFHTKGRKFSFLDRQSVLCHLVGDLCVLLQIIEIHIVVQDKHAGFLVIGNDPGGTVYVFIFQKTGMRSSIRIDQSIHTEISVVYGFPIVPAIAVNGLSILVLSVGNGMIAPLPYKAAAQQIVFLYHPEIVLKIPGPVSHAVAIFHQKEGLAGIFFKIFLNFL